MVALSETKVLTCAKYTPKIINQQNGVVATVEKVLALHHALEFGQVDVGSNWME